MELRRQRSSIAVDGLRVPVKGLESVSPDTRTAGGRCSVLPASSCTLASDSFSCSGGRRTRSFKGLDDPAASVKFTPQTAAIQSGVVAAAAGHTPTAVGCVDAGVDCAGVCASKFTGAAVGPAANDRDLASMAYGPSSKSCDTSTSIYGRAANYGSTISVRSLLRFHPSEEGKREFTSSLKPCGLVHLVDTTSSMPARPSPCFLTCRWGRRMRTLLLLSAAAAVLHILGLCSMTEVSCATFKNDETQPLLPRRTRRPRGLSVLKRKVAKALTTGVVAAEAGASGSAGSGKSSGDKLSESEEDGEGVEPQEKQEKGSAISSALLELPGPSGGMSLSASGGSSPGRHDRPAQGKALRRAQSSSSASPVVRHGVRHRGSSGSAQGASGPAGAPGTSGVATRARTRGTGGHLGKVMHFGTKALHKLSPSSHHGDYTLPLLEEQRKEGALTQPGAREHRVQRWAQFAPELTPIMKVGLGGAPSSTLFLQRDKQPVEGAAEARAGRRQARGRLPGTSGDESGERPARRIVVRPGTGVSSGPRRGSAQMKAKRRLPRASEKERTEPLARIIAAGPLIKLPPGTVSKY